MNLKIFTASRARVVVFLLCILGPGFSDTLRAQDFCDSISLDSVRYNVQMAKFYAHFNNRHQSFMNAINYPSLYLLDQNGDTLADSPNNSFVFGTGPWVREEFDVRSPLVLPLHGYIELYEGFGDSLICTFPLYINSSGALHLDEADLAGVDLFPNPASSSFSIQWDVGNFESYEIHDYTGKIVDMGILNKSEKIFTVNSSDWSRGLYVIRMLGSSGHSIVEKVLIE